MITSSPVVEKIKQVLDIARAQGFSGTQEDLLLWAAEKGHIDIARFLIETAGFDVNSQDDSGFTPLHMASQNSQLAMMEYLLDTGADFSNDDNILDIDPFSEAAVHGQLEVIELMRKRGIPMDETNGVNETLLHAAAYGKRENLAVCAFLLKNGLAFAINQPNNTGKTPLLIAATSCTLELVKFFFENGAELNVTDNSGNTSLLAAMQNPPDEKENLHILRFLLENGARVCINQANHGGETPLYRAFEQNYTQVACLLALYGEEDARVTGEMADRIIPFREWGQCLEHAEKEQKETGEICTHRYIQWAALQINYPKLEQEVARLCPELHTRAVDILGTGSDLVYAQQIGLFTQNFIENGQGITAKVPDIRYVAMNFLKETGKRFLNAADLTRAVNYAIVSNVWVGQDGKYKFSQSFSGDFLWKKPDGSDCAMDGIAAQLFVIFTRISIDWHYKETSLPSFLRLVEKDMTNKNLYLSCGIGGSHFVTPQVNASFLLPKNYLANWFIDIYLKPEKKDWNQNQSEFFVYENLVSQIKILKDYGYPIDKDLFYFGNYVDAAFSFDTLYDTYPFDSYSQIRAHMYALLKYLDTGQANMLTHLFDVRFTTMQKKQWTVVFSLLEKSNFFNIQGSNIKHSWLCAINTKDPVVVTRFLLKHGVAVNRARADGKTPLHFAAVAGRLELVELLLESGADPTRVDNTGKTPLYGAERSNHADILDVLKTYWAQPNYGDRNGSTPLHQAVCHGDRDAVKTLLEKGVPVDCLDVEWKHTPLHHAALSNQLEVAQLLLDYGADVNSTNGGDQKITPLYAAAAVGFLDMVAFLLKKGAQSAIDQADSDGLTALHVAAMEGYWDVVKLLVENGATVHIIDKLGRTPLLTAISFAQYFAQYEADLFPIAPFFLKNGARVCINQADKKGVTPLYCAFEQNYTQVACLLALYGAEDARVTGEIADRIIPFREWGQCLEHAEKEQKETGEVSANSQRKWMALKNEFPKLAHEVACLSPSLDKQSQQVFGGCLLVAGAVPDQKDNDAYLADVPQEPVTTLGYARWRSDSNSQSGVRYRSRSQSPLTLCSEENSSVRKKRRR